MNILLKKHKILALIFFLFLIPNSEMFGQRKLKSIEVKLSLSVDKDSDKENFSILFSIHNSYKKKQKVCKYMTPLEGFKGGFISVLDREGKQMEYKGINVKRSEPKKDDYVNIAPNSTVQISFNLFEVYEILEKGKYTLQFIGSPYLNKLPNSNLLEIELK